MASAENVVIALIYPLNNSCKACRVGNGLNTAQRKILLMPTDEIKVSNDIDDG